LLIGDLQLLSHAQSTWAANVTALIPSIVREPFKARYRTRGRKLQPGIHLNLLLTLACAIIVAHAAPSLAAADETAAPGQNAEIRQPEPEASPPTPAHFCQALASAAEANDLPVHFAAGAYCEVWRD
jgi:hypothetical protein